MSDTSLKQRKITINEMPSEIPDFEQSFESKDSLIKKWITNWILSALSKKTIKENDILPGKSELSSYLGVSIGTVQNAIRYVEDEGLLKSKQKIGTMISNMSNPFSDIKKSTSKREKAILAIKKVILHGGYKVGKNIPSTRKMSEQIGISQNTARLAYEYLCSEGVLESKQLRGNDSNWILKSFPVISKDENLQFESISADTLVDKIEKELKLYFAENFQIGDKIPPHEELAKKLNVSVKTVHDSISNMVKEGIIISRRGRYGSILARNPLNPAFTGFKESSIFARAEDAVVYNYQKVEDMIRSLINKEYNPGDKLPSMQMLSKKLNVSTNTIRKALMNIADDGYITFGRGRYGGTFVVDKPLTNERQQYQWLSINPDYI